MAKTISLKSLPKRLIDWYAANARELPWRVSPADRQRGVLPDPYSVWLCEIMMQQTTIPHGTPYYHAFLKRWPTVEALAGADDADVMAAWAGLGYYARARNLLKCARVVAERGSFPQTVKELIALPGIGPYTAGAIAAIAFDAPNAAAVDGNVERVMARLMALEMDWPEAKKRIRAQVGAIAPTKRTGEFAEGFMDLGATICTPRDPACGLCPISNMCHAKAKDAQARYPIKQKKAALPFRHGTVYILLNEGDVLFERRPEKGLLGGMLGLPTTAWQESAHVDDAAPRDVAWDEAGEVRHVFTHFALRLTVKVGAAKGRRKGEAWHPLSDASALPSVFSKAINLYANIERCSN